MLKKEGDSPRVVVDDYGITVRSFSTHADNPFSKNYKGDKTSVRLRDKTVVDDYGIVVASSGSTHADNPFSKKNSRAQKKAGVKQKKSK